MDNYSHTGMNMTLDQATLDITHRVLQNPSFKDIDSNFVVKVTNKIIEDDKIDILNLSLMGYSMYKKTLVENVTSHLMKSILNKMKN